MSEAKEFGLTDIRQYFHDHHLECVDGIFHEDSMQNIFILAGTSNEAAELLAKMASKHDVPILVIDETDFILMTRRISDHMVNSRNYGEVVSEKISKIAARYNRELEAKYCEEAPAFKIVVPVGSVLYCYEKDEEEDKALLASEKLSEIEEKFADAIEKEQEKIRNYRQTEKQEFEKKIEEDPEFALCTTKDLRRVYISDLINKNRQTEWFDEIYSGEGRFTWLGIDAVGTRVFNRIKDARKRLK
jgi:hypothetical protein